MLEGTEGSFSDISGEAVRAVRVSGTNPRARLSPCCEEMLHCDSLLGEGEDPLSGETAETGEVPAELLTSQGGGGVSVSVSALV